MNTLNAIAVINNLIELSGASIASIVYKSQSGKRARKTGNFNISHSLLLSRDAAYLEKNRDKVIIHLVNKGHDRAISEQAVKELIDSAIKSLSGENARSIAQINAYRSVDGSVKVHKETSNTFITFYCIQEKVFEYGEPRKPVKSKPLTLAKNEVRSTFMKSSKYQMANVDSIESFKMAGVVIE